MARASTDEIKGARSLYINKQSRLYVQFKARDAHKIERCNVGEFYTGRLSYGAIFYGIIERKYKTGISLSRWQIISRS
jgi:hypothetical protein